MKDIAGREIKVGQMACVPLSNKELVIATVTKITPKKVKIETIIPEFKSEEEEGEWWELNEELGGIIQGSWFPQAVYIIDKKGT